jgi:hypothetical protein
VGKTVPRLFGGARLREVRLQAKAVELRSTGQPGGGCPHLIRGDAVQKISSNCATDGISAGCAPSQGSL